MTTKTWNETVQNVRVNEHKFSIFEMHMLRHVHPRKIVLDVVAMIWGTYFLWNGNWPAALAAVAVFGGAGLALTWTIDAEALANTTLGKLALLHLEPWNFALNLAGAVILVYGIWMHSVETILAGSSIIVLGHFQGWEKIHSAFRLP